MRFRLNLGSFQIEIFNNLKLNFFLSGSLIDVAANPCSVVPKGGRFLDLNKYYSLSWSNFLLIKNFNLFENLEKKEVENFDNEWIIT